MSQHAQGLRVLLLPVSGDPDPWDLLLPASAVAEIVRAQPLEPPGSQAPPWLCGYLAWRGLRLPLVRPTALAAAAGGRYAAVCFAPTAGPATPFFAIESPGMPRLERVTPETLSAATGDPAAVDPSFIQVELRVLGRPAGLVDLEALQCALQSASAASGEVR
ncbi:chemotaxis protein CheW [uncultured Thiodictyon sp.]|uniref:chemotaxis protein CheW n=1 Tax=uncultured Thiodictyon sp. TaxID=1846217 RepID=UPI0025FF6130|nr:chemotaxis protein CheW [uncultured Thiodictyon sp.]